MRTFAGLKESENFFGEVASKVVSLFFASRVVLLEKSDVIRGFHAGVLDSSGSTIQRRSKYIEEFCNASTRTNIIRFNLQT